MRVAVARVLLISGLLALASCKRTSSAASPEVKQSAAPAEPLPTAAGIDPARVVAYDALPKRISPDDNPSFDGKVALGRRLFFEPALSGSGSVSCDTCHVLSNYGVDGLPVEKSPPGKLPRRNTPTLFNAATNKVFGWDGRAASLEAFLKLHLVEETGMGASESELLARVKKLPGASDDFVNGFEKGQGTITFEHTVQALAAYVRALLAPSVWEHYLTENKKSLSPEEKQGFNTFYEVGCGSCHAGANFGGQLVQKLGLEKPWPVKEGADQGLYEVTKDENDRMWFRTAPLRNLAKTGPYFHDGSVATLEEAVKLMGTYELGKELTDVQVRSIVTFLNALNGEVPAAVIQPPAPPAAPDGGVPLDAGVPAVPPR